jgi:fructose-1-phosphate kinase PfkB-like protein
VHLHVDPSLSPTLIRVPTFTLPVSLDAGDSLLGGVAHGLMQELSMGESIAIGMHAAQASLMSDHPISPDLRPQ